MSKMIGSLAAVAVGMSGLAVSAAPPAENASIAAEAPALTPEEITKLGGALAEAIRGQLSGRPASTSSADYEGVIVFTASQNNSVDDVILSALDRIEPGASDNLKVAIDNVRKAIAAKRLKRGTATTLSGNTDGGFGTGFGGFSNPAVNTGGGSSNYAQ